jgi:hypothetical protein
VNREGPSGWIKGKLVSPAGAAAVTDAEAAPQEPENTHALQATLTKALKADPDAAKVLEDLLKRAVPRCRHKPRLRSTTTTQWGKRAAGVR